MTEYELEREQRILQNKERMKALNLQELAAGMAPAPKAPATKRSNAIKRKRLTQQLPRRRSLRVQGEASDGNEIYSESRGKITVVSATTESSPKNRAGEERERPTESAEPVARHPKESIPFISPDSGDGNDAAFIRLLASAETSPKTTKKKGVKRSGAVLGPGTCQYNNMSLMEEDVAKVTNTSITHMAFMPREDVLVLAAADKRGCVGLWSVDYHRNVASNQEENAIVSDQKNEDEDEDEFNGVICFNTHYEYISGLKWAVGGGSLFELHTCSYDGSVRRLDTESSAFVLAWGDEEMEYSAMDLSSDGSVAYIGDKDGGLDVIDLRTGTRTVPKGIDIHKKKVNTVHVDPCGAPILATSSTDSTLALWDLRKFGRGAKPSATASHRQTCQAAYLAPDGSQRVVSTSFDDTVRVWDGKKGLDPIVSIKHDNQTGRWVLPFRAVWGMASNAVIIGNMRRYVDVMDAKDGKMLIQLHGEYMTAIAARNCCHPSLPLLASGTASGRLHVYRS